jgi:hypothetical protein
LFVHNQGPLAAAEFGNICQLARTQFRLTSGLKSALLVKLNFQNFALGEVN